MAHLSDYAEEKLVEHLLSVNAFTMPTATWLKLHTGDPGDAGTSNASAETTRKEATYGEATAGASDLTGAVEWPSWPVGANGETITWVSVWDAETNGNCLCRLQMTVGVAMATGQTFRLTAAAFTLA